MVFKSIKSTILIVIALALTCWAAWIIEVKWIVGWTGLQWLLTDLYSPYLICFLVALAYILPFLLKYGRIDSKLTLTFLTFFVINLTAYLLSEVVFKTLYTPSPISLSKVEAFSIRFLHLAIFVLYALLYYFVTDKLIMKIARQAIAVFMLCVALMFVLGMGTNYLFRGFGSSYGFIDAIKMGYPQFWICLLMGLASIYIIERYLDETE
jgi:hypothetical protein